MDLTSAICTLGCAMALALAGCSMPGGAGSTNLAETEPSPSGSPSPTTGPVGSGGPDATAPTAAGASTLPCDVDTVLVGHCQQCHSNPPQYGAPMPLVTYADLQAPSHSNPS